MAHKLFILQAMLQEGNSHGHGRLAAAVDTSTPQSRVGCDHSVPFYAKQLKLLLRSWLGSVGILQIYPRMTRGVQIEVLVLEFGLASALRQLYVDVALAQRTSNLKPLLAYAGRLRPAL